MENRILLLIKDRVEENKKGHYSSMIKLLINIYGFQFYDGVRDYVKVGKYIENEFRNNLAKEILCDTEKQKRYLPQDFSVDRDQNIIKDSNGYIIYQEQIKVDA